MQVVTKHATPQVQLSQQDKAYAALITLYICLLQLMSEQLCSRRRQGMHQQRL